TTGLSFTVGDGVDDLTMTFTGSQDDINAALDGLVFTPASGLTGTVTLVVDANDLGNVGSGGPLSTSEAVLIEVTEAQEDNQPPVITVPGGQSTDQDTPLECSDAEGNAIAIADPDAGD